METGLNLEAHRAGGEPARYTFHSVSSFPGWGIPGKYRHVFSAFRQPKPMHLGDGKSNVNTGCKSYFQTNSENNTPLRSHVRGLST